MRIHPTPNTKIALWLMVVLLVVGTGLLVHGMQTSQRLHADEAYFLTFARQAAVNGDWLLSGALDKPPLVIYAQALSLTAFAIDADANGVLHLDVYRGEFAGRMIGIYSALLGLSFFYVLARQYYPHRYIAVLGACLFMASPFWVAWGASAFLDMPMLAISLASWALMNRRKPLASGIGWGLAFCAKPQAIFLLPLILINGLNRPIRWTQFIVGVGIILLGLLIWDMVRPEDSIFALGAVNNIAQDAFWNDPIKGAYEWWTWLQWFAGQGWLSVVLILFAIVYLPTKTFNKVPSHHATIPQWVQWFWGIWILAYSLLHISTRLNIYDRYLLLVLPVIILLVIRGWERWQFRVLFVVAIIIMGSASWQISELPIGSDKGENAHMDDLADYLNSLPVATVIYDRWLGWQLGYYMGEWTNKRRVYYPTEATLLEGALGLPERGRRYFVTPRDADYERYILSLTSAGFTILLDQEFDNLLVYRLTPP